MANLVAYRLPSASSEEESTLWEKNIFLANLKDFVIVDKQEVKMW